jgi:uncharacterized protein with beta-barrel porin domain
MVQLPYATANYGAIAYTAAINATYEITIPTKNNPNFIHLIPIIGLAYSAFEQNSFTETGAGVFNLSVNGNQAQSLISTIGTTIEFPIPINKQGGYLIPSLGLAYNYNFYAKNTNNASATASFANLPDTGIMTNLGQNAGSSSLVVTPTISVAASSDINLYVTGNYQISNVGSSYSYSGGLSVRF